jgi:phosphotransferase system enzyme I (PtsI)
VCGEIAGDPGWTEELLRAGIRNLSVTPNRIPALKERIRSIIL